MVPVQEKSNHKLRLPAEGKRFMKQHRRELKSQRGAKPQTQREVIKHWKEIHFLSISCQSGMKSEAKAVFTLLFSFGLLPLWLRKSSSCLLTTKLILSNPPPKNGRHYNFQKTSVLHFCCCQFLNSEQRTSGRKLKAPLAWK